LTKSVEHRLHLKRRLYRFQLKRGGSISDHINNYTKLLVDLANVDVINDKDKALILLSSLDLFFTLINERTSLSYLEVTTALVNLELRRKDKESLNITATKVLTVRVRSPNQRGGNNGRSKSKSRYDNEV